MLHNEVLTLTCTFFFIGLLPNCLIIKYLDQKLPANKTAFDCVVIETFYSSICTHFVMALYNFVGLIFYPANLSTTLTIFVFQYISYTWFMTSCIVTVGLKYLFISYGFVLMEKSDAAIVKWSNIAKLIVSIISMVMDNFGPLQLVPLPFHIMANLPDE